MTLSRVGSRELAFLKTPENLIRLAHQVFSPMAFLRVGSPVLAPGTQPLLVYHYLPNAQSSTRHIEGIQ